LRPEGNPRAARGFTLVEIAVVMMIVALLLGGLMYTLAAQIEQRAIEETRSRLEAARELLLSYAIVNGRLPCPAIATSSGGEDPAGGGTCANPYGGFLPARTIGYQIVDANGFAVDSWQNRIRYAVSAAALTGCAVPSTLPHFTNSANLKQNGITCQPSDLVVCKSSTGITNPGTPTATCGPAANALTNQTVVVAIVHSIGKNGSVACPACVDEAANTNGDPAFVSHAPAPAEVTNGEFDDQLVWIPVGELYGRMISAGVLP
jgi:prepilin-type N-terminal cleavage/methylation domain-containing protein